MTKSKYELKTEAYTSLLNRIQASNIKLSDLDKMTYQEFNQRINSNAKTDGLFKRAKALARNIQIQNDVNTLIKKKNIQFLVKPIKEKEYIPKYVSKKQLKKVQHKPQRLRKLTDNYFYERIIIKQNDLNKVRDLLSNKKDAWNLELVKKRKLFAKQEIQITINFNLYKLIETNKGIERILIQSYKKDDSWFTAISGISREKTLVQLFDIAVKELIEFINMMLQSNIEVEIINTYTIIYREAR